MLRPTAILFALALTLSVLPLAAAEDPTSGNCDRVPVPLNANVGLVCALAGLGTNASCPADAGAPIDATCTSLYSWSWLAFSSLGLAGEVRVTIKHSVQVCVDLVGSSPVCDVHAGERVETCVWDVGGECRGEGRVDEAWGPQHLEMGEQLKVLAHIDISMEATSHAQGVPVGEVSYGDSSDGGDSVDVLDNGRD